MIIVVFCLFAANVLNPMEIEKEGRLTGNLEKW